MSKDNSFKLYKERGDGENIYLQIEDLKECCFEIWETEVNKKSIVKVKIPLKAWKQIVKDWKHDIKD